MASLSPTVFFRPIPSKISNRIGKPLRTSGSSLATGHRGYRPINYLVLIGEVNVLPLLFEKILLPSVVQTELSDPLAPPLVRSWIANAPPWLEIANASAGIRPAGIHPGEAAAIDLAVSLHADLLLIDDRAGVRLARQKGLRVTGTLGVLDLAAARGLLDFKQAIDRLRPTTFRFPEAILAALLQKHSGDVTG